MKLIQILCLHGVRTGGPEAIHQLSDALIDQGFDARLTYYTWPEIARLEQASPQDGYTFGERQNQFEEYARYKVNVSDRVENREGTIVVLPETLCHLAPKFNKATVLIWWLSVDNGFGALSRVNLDHLRQPNIWHGCQSEYATRTLRALQLWRTIPLTDYTVDLSQYATPLPTVERPKRVVFHLNHKVVTNVPEVTNALHEMAPEVTHDIIGGIPRQVVAQAFAEARVFVDLGCLPGKDRMPREASHMGCSVLVGAGGSGRTDYPFAHVLEPDEQADSKSIARRILRLVDTYGADQAVNIRGERANFFELVRDAFSVL